MMVRSLCILAVAVSVLGGQVAYGTGRVESYSGNVPSGGNLLLVSGPLTSDFIVTDVVCSAGSTTVLQLEQLVGTDYTIEFKSYTGRDAAFERVFHFESGLRFSAESQIRAANPGSADAHVTISGYFPDNLVKGTVPAVGNVGLGVMVLLLLGAGGG